MPIRPQLARSKRIVLIIVLLLAVALSALVFLYLPQLRVLTGYAAKNMCSCVFVSGMNQDRAQLEDLGFSPINLAGYHIDRSAQLVSASVWGLAKQTAVYRKGLGCTLVHDRSPKSVSNQSVAGAAQMGFWDWETIDLDTLSPLQRNAVSEIGTTCAALFEETSADKLITRGVLVSINDKVITELYASGFGLESPLLGWSMTKTITALAVGALIDDGYLELHKPGVLSPYTTDTALHRVTLAHLLQMNSGMEWVEDYSTVCDATEMLFLSDTLSSRALNTSLEHEPGTFWEYSSGTSNILMRLCADAYGRPERFTAYLHERLFAPIGARSMLIECDAGGYPMGSSYGYATVRDWARFGRLIAQRGVWEGDTLLSPEFIDFCLSEAAGSEGGYGAQIWLNRGGKLPDVPRDAWFMDGFHGQRVFVVPSLNLMVVRLGVTYNRDRLDFNAWLSEICRHAQNLQ